VGTFHIKKPELSYVHVPRTGMAMKKIIAEWLKPNFIVDDTDDWMIDHPNLEMVRQRIPAGKTMTVVRNPWQRVYSLYRKVSTEGYWLDWNGKTLLDLKPINEWVTDYCDPDVPFEFPRWFTRFTNQVDFINYQGQWVDFICKAENLENDFLKVKEYLDCNFPLPNISGYDHWEFKKYFSDQSIRLIAKLHERDIEYFKYSLTGC
jgi:chondroitin 4-sulfotransferase 11